MPNAFNTDLFATTKAAYVVYKHDDRKVRAMRRFRCPEWVDGGSPGTLTSGGTEIVDTPSLDTSFTPVSTTTPTTPTIPPSGNVQGGDGGGGGY